MSIQNLSRAIAENTSSDAFALTFTVQQWETLAGYLQPIDTGVGDVLIEQGTPDRSVFFIESGAISVHRVEQQGADEAGRADARLGGRRGLVLLAQPHSANVVVTGAGRVWRLNSIRFAEMSNRQPNMALEIAMALGAVIAKRMAHRSKRVAVT
jgi:CRP/FNR family cyclic AMP-dependent transcriptional regulator